jgi:hypothetical protein
MYEQFPEIQEIQDSCSEEEIIPLLPNVDSRNVLDPVLQVVKEEEEEEEDDDHSMGGKSELAMRELLSECAKMSSSMQTISISSEASGSIYNGRESILNGWDNDFDGRSGVSSGLPSDIDNCEISDASSILSWESVSRRSFGSRGSNDRDTPSPQFIEEEVCITEEDEITDNHEGEKETEIEKSEGESKPGWGWWW